MTQCFQKLICCDCVASIFGAGNNIKIVCPSIKFFSRINISCLLNVSFICTLYEVSEKAKSEFELARKKENNRLSGPFFTLSDRCHRLMSGGTFLYVLTVNFHQCKECLKRGRCQKSKKRMAHGNIKPKKQRHNDYRCFQNQC